MSRVSDEMGRSVCKLLEQRVQVEAQTQQQMMQNPEMMWGANVKRPLSVPCLITLSCPEVLKNTEAAADELADGSADDEQSGSFEVELSSPFAASTNPDNHSWPRAGQ